MPKSDNQKLKILYIKDYLEKNSYEDHPVRAGELIKMLAKHNIACDRKTVYSDIAALIEFGMDIISIPGKNGGYYLASRCFELPELKLLSDAVLSSRYLSEKKSRELIGKLCEQCNESDAKLIRGEMIVSGRIKTMNETVYYSVDRIQEAIAKKKQITFRYFDWDFGGKRKYRDKPYRASPYGIYQDHENCYLLAYTERHGATNFRLDRMTDISVTEDERVYCRELDGKNLLAYANRLFQMFNGETVNVKMRFANHLLNAVIDRFGKDTMLIPDGEDHFVFTVDVAVSPMFLSWVIGFGGQAQILYPRFVVDQCRDLCTASLSRHPG